MADNTKKILVAVSDKDDLASYGQYLNAKGFSAVLLGDEDSVAAAALKENPVIIITEICPKSVSKSAQSVNGEKIFNMLKDNPQTKIIPFIFIADDVVNIKGFRKEVDSLFIRPINMDELFARINQRLTRHRQEALGDKQLTGRLSHVSLVDMLQVLHMNRKEGVLSLSHEDKKASIYIKNGEMLNAVSGDVEKEKALFRLLIWKDGRFEFLPKPIDMLPKIQGSFDNLLMEGMRQHDELERNKDGFPKADALLKTKVDFSILPKGLKPVIYEVLHLIEPYPRAGDLVNHCSFPDYEVYQTIVELLKKDIIEETKADKSSSDRGAANPLLSLSQVLMVKEKMTGDSGKVMLLYSNKDLLASFVDSCKELPRFAVNRQFAGASEYRKNPLGEVGLLKIHSETELIFFAVPMSKNMLPIMRAFSSDVIGSILILDDEGLNNAKAMKEYLASVFITGNMPQVYTFFTKDKVEEKKQDALKKEIGAETGMPVFLSNLNAVDVFPIFNALFDCFLQKQTAKAV